MQRRVWVKGASEGARGRCDARTRRGILSQRATRIPCTDAPAAPTLGEMASVYRDPVHALRQRLDDALARVAHLEARLTPTFWRSLGPEARRTLDSLRAEVAEERRPLHERAELAGRYAERLDAAVREALGCSEIDLAAPGDCPSPPPDSPAFPLGERFGLGRDDAALALLRGRLGSIARRLDPGAQLEDFGARGVLARVRVEGAPLVLTGTLGRGGAWPGAAGTEVALRARTSVGPRAGVLTLAPRGDALQLLSLLTRRRHAGTGDDDFDGWFEVEAEPGAARALLGDDVRAALCAVARDDAPTLQVSAGVAELRWRFEPSHATVRAAVDALRGLRAAPPMPLLREPSRRGAAR
jgi:hypothetical protein